MSDDTKKGLLRVGADFFGGPVDSIRDFLQNTPPTLLPPGPLRAIAHTIGLPSKPILPKAPPGQTIGSSDWIAEKAGIQGDSPEYQRARLAGNLGLMALPWAVETVRNFNPRQGDLNMWIGPKARTYDKDKADDTFRNFKQSFSGQLKASEIDDFNEAEMLRTQSIIDPYTKKVLQYRPDPTIVPPALESNLIAQSMKQEGMEIPLHAILSGDERLGEYPGLAKMPVRLTADPSSSIGSYDPMKQRFFLNPAKSSATSPVPGVGIDATLRHEMTHAMQHAEGLPSGGSVPRVRHLAGLMRDQLEMGGVDVDQMGGDPFVRLILQAEKSPYDVYRRIAGEVLADNAMTHNNALVISQPTAPRFAGTLALDGGAMVPVSEYLMPGRGPFYRTPGDLTQSSSVGQSQALTEALQRALANRRP